ncbi:MAG: class I SAM-dependent methyltransferase [Cytophagales bacterium]|nr:MAG: class I SAM-dependent methyltransferase [Cytophagales bacterium]
MYNVAQLGQVFTPDFIVSQMLSLRKNQGRVLEPSSGDGAFVKKIPHCVGIEIDGRHCGTHSLHLDFFDYPTTEKFDTIIGNPPYVRYQDIAEKTKRKLSSKIFDERSNLYLFFIEKCIHHLNNGGELIFITPRDFLKATASTRLNALLYEEGTVTDLIDLGDKRIFQGFSPNCIIFRYEKGNFSRITNGNKHFTYNNGQLLFTDKEYGLSFKEIFRVKVGAVSGCDAIFTHETYGNTDFVCSSTAKTGKTKRMIFNTYSPYLETYKTRLLNRKIRHFEEHNWWHWGRLHHQSTQKRIYVNCKTRNQNPFFLHDCKNYDGSVLAIFPKNEAVSEKKLCHLLNQVDWDELGFRCDGRYLFSQKSLENTFLPSVFTSFLPRAPLFASPIYAQNLGNG